MLYKTRVAGEPRERTGDDEAVRVLRFAKPYVGFNAEQIDGLPATFAAAPAIEPELRRAIEDAALAAVPAGVEVSGAHAFFDRTRDLVRLPPPEVFRSADDFRATRWHELAPWTGGAARLGRTFSQRFGDDAYAFEELVAELASVILGMMLGAPPALLDDHASYIAGWVKLLTARPQALLDAAGHAQKAVDHLLAHGAAAAMERRHDAPPTECPKAAARRPLRRRIRERLCLRRTRNPRADRARCVGARLLGLR